MPHASLTRRVSFAAAHRYRRTGWSDEQNFAVFGKCSFPGYHGHNYTCDVTVRGSIDPVTGFLVDLAELDRVLGAEVMDRFDHRNINLDVPGFGDDALIPSGENLARFIFEKLQSALAGDIAVTCVTISEDQTLSASYGID